MANVQRYVPSAPSQLLAHILERPELLAAVRELPANALSRLIDRIGLEDSGELIALASTEQLQVMFDEDLWRADAPGGDERFDPQRFALWLQVMGEAGSEFVVRRLVELPLDLLTLAVNRAVLVVDLDALQSYWGGARDESGQLEKALESSTYEEWEEFCLIARDPNSWDDVWNALLALDRDHHHRLRQLLECCCAMSTEFINGQGGLYEVLTSDEMLESDALAERDDRRAVQGFVSGSDARAFLALAAEAGTSNDRDAITAAYFRALDTGGRTRTSGAPRLTAQTGTASVQELLQLIAASDELHVAGPRLLGGNSARGASARATASGKRGTKTSSRRKPTHAADAAALMTPSGTDVTLAAPKKSAFAAALSALSSTDPALHGVRMEELGYLANVVIAGCTHLGRKLRPVEALEAAVATCGLGLELWERAAHGRSAASDAQLLQEVGCDRLFRAAWVTLQRELVQPARAVLEERCASLDDLGASEARELLRKDAVFEVRALCDAGALGYDNVAFTALLALAESLPSSIAKRAASMAREPSGSWIGTRAELDRARQRLSELARDD